MKKNIIFLVIITVIYIALCVLNLLTGISFTGIPLFILLLYIAVKLNKIEENL